MSKKLTDEELLRLIWINQLKILADGVVQRYIANGLGLCDVSPFDYAYCSSEHRLTRGSITTEIGKPQLLTRLRALCKAGKIHTMYDCHSLLTFFIDNEKANEAFLAARMFWKSKGIPEGVDENGKKRFVKMDNYIEVREECQAFLIDKFVKGK